jgi:S1-C subfamily serine protease
MLTPTADAAPIKVTRSGRTDLSEPQGAAILGSMDHGDPLTEGAFPDEPGEGDEEPIGDLPLRGWVDPDDRLWLHPSEVAKLAGAGPSMARSGSSSPSRRRSGRTLVGAALVVALLAAAAVKLPLSSGPSPLPVNTTSLTTAVFPAAAVRAVAARLGSSLVGLVVDRGQHQTMVTGAVIHPGNLVVTGLAAVQNASVVRAVAASGRRMAASVVGTDPTTGVAVVRVSGKLPPAQFADDLDPGQLALTECLCAHAATNPSMPAATVGMARVQAVGVQPGGPHRILDALEADGTRHDTVGSVLADGQGHVAGILESKTAVGGSRLDVFVPGWLASAVAEQLATGHRVVHGWLDVTGESVRGGCGAKVLDILTGGPANQALESGDVIVAVDGRPVCTWAQLQADLYVIAPDEPVELQLDTPNGSTTVAVALSSSPS